LIRRRWYSRAVASAGILAVGLFGGAPGWADSATGNAAIAADTLPITAAAFSAKAGDVLKGDVLKGDVLKAVEACEPSPTEDVWYFATVRPVKDHQGGVTTTPTVAPAGGEEAQAAAIPRFVSVRLTFVLPDALEPRVETIVGGAASIRTPAGWTLIAASAVIKSGETGTPAATPSAEPTAAPAGLSFVLAATCPARTAEKLFVPATPAARPKAKPAPPRARTTAAVSVATTTTLATAPGYGAAKSSTSLPTTGPDITGMFTLGVTLVVAGVVLLIVRRYRDKPAPQPEPSDWY
jgi:hypothetical protein